MDQTDSREPRNRNTPSRLNYSRLGGPTGSSQPQGIPAIPPSSRAMSQRSLAASQMSVRNRIRTIQLDKEGEIEELARAHNQDVEKRKLEIRKEKEKLAELQEDATQLEAVEEEKRNEDTRKQLAELQTNIARQIRLISRLEDEHETAVRIFEGNRASIQRSLKLQEKKLEIEEEELNEQTVSSDADSEILQVLDREHSQQNQGSYREHGNPPARNNHPDRPFSNTFDIPRTSSPIQTDNRVQTWIGNSSHNYNRDLPNFNFQLPRAPTPAEEINDKMIQLMNAQLSMMEKAVRPSSDLPVFTGKAEEWPIFFNEYQRTTGRNSEASVTLIRLRKALKGAARDAVLALLDDPDSVPDIIGKLKNRFGRPEFILESLIDKVREAKPPKIDNPASIIQFGTEVQNLVVRIKVMKETRYLYDISLLKELTSKLPHSYAEQWIDWLHMDPRRDRNLSTFAEWIAKKVAVAEELHKPIILDEKRGDRRHDRGKHGVHAAEVEESASTATVKSFKEKGPCFEVPELKTLPLDKRWEIVKEMRLCRICLRRGHSPTKCRRQRMCNIDDCGKPHHRLLHSPSTTTQHTQSVNNKPPRRSPTPPAVNDVPEGEGNLSAAKCSGSLPIIPVWISGPKGKKKVYALLDTGASFTMLEEDIADEVGLKGRKEKLTFTVYGDKKTEESTVITMTVSGTSRGAKQYNIREARTVKKLGIPGINVNVEELKRKHTHLRKMNMKSIHNAIPQMLLGFDSYGLFFPKRTLEPQENSEDPYAFKSKLGWYILQKGNVLSCAFAHSPDADEELHAMVKQYFTTESFGTKPIINSERSKDDKRALELLDKLTIKKEDRWETGLLWKKDELILPDSKLMAMKRLRTMERKMDLSSEFADLVNKKFQDYIAKGYLVPRNQLDVEKQVSTERKWYLPWFFAYHPTKKPRLVFDGAAKVNGTSLNDFLLKGPDFLNPLPSVLTRFRRHKIAITGDIREMFHQVLLKKEDWPSQTILYRGMDREEEPQEYYMTVLFFGSASSPCSAIFAKNRNAEQFREKYPVAVDAILHDFYMDDFLSGAETEENAILLLTQVTEIHLAGGFELVKWNSSSEQVWRAIPEAIRAEGDICFTAKDDVHVEKTLGLYWSPSKDEFCFKLNFHRVKKNVASGELIPTKREMASIIMAVFDPLGFLATLKVKALILIQDVWRSEIGWDDQVPVSIFEKWKNWLLLLTMVDTVKIPRKLTSISRPDKIETHVFCDASEEAFACAAYLTFSTGGRTEVAFVNGKCRVAPLKGLTVPKMELQAALMGARLSKTITETFGSSLKIGTVHFWSDSKSVLCQIRSSTLRYKVFEANRIGEILELTNVNQWKWIPTQLNVADDATRSLSACEVNSGSRWLTGSSFLKDDESTWPTEKSNDSEDQPLEDMGVKVVAAAAVANENSIPLVDFNRFSNWSRLVRAIALIIRAQRRIRSKTPTYFKLEDFEKAKRYLMQLSQMQTFSMEYEAIKMDSNVQSTKLKAIKSSKIRQLSPIMKDGLIVLGGRIDNAPGVSSAVKNPPILSPKHRYTQLLIQHHHELNFHQGQEAVVNNLRQEVWILDCRAAVRSCWANCLVCNHRRLKPQQPEMGQIPAERLGESHKAFFHTGVDYFGPFDVTVGRTTQKRYGALFTCLSTRAVHLELVDSLNTGDMIEALVRFSCLRVKPAHIWSDNGTNFIGASREVKAALKQLDHKDIQNKMLPRQLEWHNTPPSSPFMGGAWESLIGIVKKILKSMLKENTPRESTMRTLFAEIMEIMNNRPLTYASSDPNDSLCITPNSLLRLQNVEGQSIPGCYENGDKYRAIWKYGQCLADEFWKRWIQEYLPTLAKRNKWHDKAKPLQVGDLVIVVDDQSPRSGWKKGVLTRVFPGKDGQVRVVEVRVAHVKPEDPKKKVSISLYRRPAAKIIPLGLRIASSRWEGEMAALEENNSH